jgi:prepilin-type N-terminal cleavage/methylation domain-containing protein
MKYDRKSRSRRPAFTMVELVVVVAIIALLIALILPAVIKGLSKGTQTQAKTEMAQLETALAAAKQTLSPDNPALVLPSYIVLYENIGNYFLPAATLQDKSSYSYLVRIFGKRAMASTNVINWSGNPSGTANRTFKLTGPTALVFWVGGIPGLLSTGSPSCLGFSTNVSDPWGGGTGTRKGPFFEFQANRLVQDPNNPGFLMYLDAYQTSGTGPYGTGQPYVYFTSYQGNDYNSYTGGIGGDCCGPAPVPILSPYGTNGASAPFINPNGVQIICAGKDGTFGQSSSYGWSASSGYPATIPASTPPQPNPGSDDQANFSTAVLGAGMTSN